MAAPPPATPGGDSRPPSSPPVHAFVVPGDRPGAAAGTYAGPRLSEAERAVSISTEARLGTLSTDQRTGARNAARRDRVAWLIIGGRALLIWLPVYCLLAQTTPAPKAAVTACAISVIWLLGLRAALSAYFTLGPAVGAAVGTAMGLVTVSAFDLWVPDVDLGTARLAEAGLAVFALSAAWEHAVRSIAKRRVLVVGTGGCASEVLAELRRDDRVPFTMLVLVGEGRDAPAEDVPRLGTFEELPRI